MTYSSIICGLALILTSIMFVTVMDESIGMIKELYTTKRGIIFLIITVLIDALAINSLIT